MNPTDVFRVQAHDPVEYPYEGRVPLDVYRDAAGHLFAHDPLQGHWQRVGWMLPDESVDVATLEDEIKRLVWSRAKPEYVWGPDGFTLRD